MKTKITLAAFLFTSIACTSSSWTRSPFDNRAPIDEGCFPGGDGKDHLAVNWRDVGPLDHGETCSMALRRYRAPLSSSSPSDAGTPDAG